MRSIAALAIVTSVVACSPGASPSSSDVDAAGISGRWSGSLGRFSSMEIDLVQRGETVTGVGRLSSSIGEASRLSVSGRYVGGALVLRLSADRDSAFTSFDGATFEGRWSPATGHAVRDDQTIAGAVTYAAGGSVELILLKVL
jgi:hypothetical protein